MKVFKTSQSVSLSKVISDITPYFNKRYQSSVINDGMVGLFETNDGHPVEVVIRPMRYGKYTKDLLEEMRNQGKTDDYHRLKSYEANYTPQYDEGFDNDLKQASVSQAEKIVNEFNLREITPNKLPTKLTILYRMGLTPIEGAGVYKFKIDDKIIYWENGKWKIQ